MKTAPLWSFFFCSPPNDEMPHLRAAVTVRRHAGRKIWRRLAR